MSRFAIKKTSIHGLHVIQRKPIGDERGYLERLFCNDELKPIIGQRRIVQINHTLTAKVGTVRGMHFQHPPHAEMKLVSCLRGEVFDVAVDLRRDSPTFLQWHAEILSEENRRTFCIPEGFAHGFLALQDDTHFLYKTTDVYARDCERSIRWDDPAIGIDWPLPQGLGTPAVAPKDAAAPLLATADLPG